MRGEASVPALMAHPLRSVLRAVLQGLSFGLVGAAFVLLWAASTNYAHTCAFPGTEECEFELTTAEDVARLQAYAAIGFSLVAGGMFLSTRKRA